MAYARTRYFLISCYLFLTTFTTPRAAALSFDYNFTTPRDREQLKFINASYAGSDRVILTDDRSNLTGRVVHRKPVRLWDNRTGRRASFTTSFHFAIVQDNNKTDNLSRGDGMAFFLGPFPATTTPPGSNGGLLGLFSNPNSTGAADSRRPSHTLGVEFDTRWNDGWDPSNEDGGAAAGDHIGIDVNGIRSNRTRGLPPLSLHGIMWGIITYDGESKVMKVALRKTELAAESSTTYEFNATMDLRDDAGLVQDAAVGFSAATGVLCESHQLLAWSFHSTDPSLVKTKMWVIFLAVTAVLLAGLLVALLYRTFMQRPKRCLNGNCLQVARKFSYSELAAATENFSPGRKIGKGSFGDVYRGLLPVPDLREVAVKEMQQPASKRNRKNYVHEIETLCQLRHKNLLRLIGWCDDDGRLVLVYELEPNGSVSDHLHCDGGAGGRTLTWPKRYKILLGVATAIDYLHNGAYDSAERYVLHRDIKPSNVMLGEGFEAKLGDFGLVRQVSRHDGGGGGTPRTTVIGSMDYMDPKYIQLGTLSAASDVYSFGLVLLEMATGVRPSVQGTAAHRNTLIAAVRESHSRNAILEMIDERLRGELMQWWWQMECVMVTGLKCVEPERDDRPSIKDVIDLLSKHEQSLASNHYLRDSSVRPKDRFRFILTRKAAFANARAWTLAY